MNDLPIQILKISYAGIGILALIGYWPTIKDLYYNKVPSANLSSYIIWTICSGTAFLYSIFVLQDILFRFVSGTGFLACTVILVLILSLRNKK